MLKHLDEIITDPFFSALITSYILGAVQVQGPKSVQKQQRGLKLAKDQALLPSALKNQFELPMEGVQNAQNEVLQIFIPKIAKQENILQQQSMIQHPLVIQQQPLIQQQLKQQQPLIQQQLKQQQLVIQKQKQLEQRQLEQEQLVIQKQKQLEQRQLEQEQLVIQKQKQLERLKQEQLEEKQLEQLEEKQSGSQTMVTPWLEAKQSLHRFLSTILKDKEVKDQYMVGYMLTSPFFLNSHNLQNSVELQKSQYLANDLDGLLYANLHDPQLKLDIQNQRYILRKAQQQYLMLEREQKEMQGDLQRLESKLQLLKMEGNLQQEELQRQGDLGLHGMQADLRTQQEILQWMRGQVDAQNKMENVKQQQQQMLNNMQAPIQEWQDLASLTARQAQKVLAETQKQLQIAQFWLKLNDISTYLNAAPNVLEVFFNDCGINSSYIPTIQTTVATTVHVGNSLKLASNLIGDSILTMYGYAAVVYIANPLIMTYVDSNPYAQNITNYLHSEALKIYDCSQITDRDLNESCGKNQEVILSAIDMGLNSTKVALVTFVTTLLPSLIGYGMPGFGIAFNAAFKMGVLDFGNSMLEKSSTTSHEVVELFIGGIIAASSMYVTHSFFVSLFLYVSTEYVIDNVPFLSKAVHESKFSHSVGDMVHCYRNFISGEGRNVTKTETSNLVGDISTLPEIVLPDLFFLKTYVNAFGDMVSATDSVISWGMESGYDLCVYIHCCTQAV